MLSVQASAQPAPADPRTFGDIHPNLVAIQDAAFLVAATHCTTPACRAMVLIYRAMDIIDEGMVTTMGVARPLPPNRDQIVDRRWRNEILSHPELFSAVCGKIAELASRYRADEFHLGDKSVAIGVIELAGRIDGKRDLCLGQVLAAFPHIPDAGKVIEIAHHDCLYSWKPWTDCKRIAR